MKREGELLIKKISIAARGHREREPLSLYRRGVAPFWKDHNENWRRKGEQSRCNASARTVYDERTATEARPAIITQHKRDRPWHTRAPCLTKRHPRETSVFSPPFPTPGIFQRKRERENARKNGKRTKIKRNESHFRASFIRAVGSIHRRRIARRLLLKMEHHHSFPLPTTNPLLITLSLFPFPSPRGR